MNLSYLMTQTLTITLVNDLVVCNLNSMKEFDQNTDTQMEKANATRPKIVPSQGYVSNKESM